jgi:integrase
MKCWTRAEYLKFSEYMMDDPVGYYYFQMLYWCGLREGEALALTIDDFDFAKKTVSITKTFQHLKGKDVITEPKTPKSNRVVTIPAMLVECLREYMGKWYGLEQDDRIFPYTKNIVNHVMTRACEAVGLRKIRVHDLRHSHAALLIEMGCTPLLLAERLGHERVQTTLEIYGHLYPNKQAEVAIQLNGVATQE